MSNSTDAIEALTGRTVGATRLRAGGLPTAQVSIPNASINRALTSALSPEWKRLSSSLAGDIVRNDSALDRIRTVARQNDGLRRHMRTVEMMRNVTRTNALLTSTFDPLGRIGAANRLNFRVPTESLRLPQLLGATPLATQPIFKQQLLPISVSQTLGIMDVGRTLEAAIPVTVREPIFKKIAADLADSRADLLTKTGLHSELVTAASRAAERIGRPTLYDDLKPHFEDPEIVTEIAVGVADELRRRDDVDRELVAKQIEPIWAYLQNVPTKSLQDRFVDLVFQILVAYLAAQLFQ